MTVIAMSRKARGNVTKCGARAATALALCLALSGCMSTSFDFFGSKPDSTVTNSLAAKKSSETVSDEVTVRNAVTSADLDKLANAPLPWANASTGSAGVVSTISEARADGVVCRSFVTTRHAYDGIANFAGEACLGTNGEWRLMDFARQD